MLQSVPFPLKKAWRLVLITLTKAVQLFSSLSAVYSCVLIYYKLFRFWRLFLFSLHPANWSLGEYSFVLLCCKEVYFLTSINCMFHIQDRQKCLHPWSSQFLALFCLEFLPLCFSLYLNSSNMFRETKKAAAAINMKCVC